MTQTPRRDARGRFLPKRRRNPNRRKSTPTHDLFGERGHKLDLFGGKEYERLARPKRKRGERKAKQRLGQGMLSFQEGLFG